MSFLRHGEIYHFDEGAIPADHALAHRNDEFPAGYSLAGCTPAEPASASPAGAHFASKRLRSTIQFQRTANSVLTVCLTPGDNPRLVDHYSKTELADDLGDGGKSYATRIVYKDFLARWVRPAWGGLNIRAVRTIAVEHWLHQLQRGDGSPMAPSTKAKIRNLMSVLFNHAIRYEWLEQGRNPILLVRQSAKRQKIPEYLDAEELRALLPQLERRFRVMVFLDAVTGLRRSEFLALKWRNIDFGDLQINVRHSIYLNVVGNCKTEASRKPVPMDPILASELRTWKQETHHGQPNDCVFASPHTQGRHPYWPDSLLSHVIRPAAMRAGIRKRIGWHTFRHSFSTLLMANGENVKVVQELMRHANCRRTLEIYSQAPTIAKREAQHRVVEMILPQ